MSKLKAKRKILEFDFETEGASVHLVSKSQGGAANGFKTLITKSLSTKELPDVTGEIVKLEKKLEQIKVTMSMQEFLRKFFNLYYDDAELLTKLLGYQTEYESYLESNQDEEPYDPMSYLNSRMESFEVMKSMHEGTQQELSALDLVSILEIQSKIEKQLEENMDKITIEKSRFESLENIEKSFNALEADNVALKTDNELIKAELAEFKKSVEDNKLKALEAELAELVEAEEIPTIAKSLISLDEASAQLIIKSLKTKKEVADANIEKSKLFEEVGHGEDTPVLTKEQAFEARLAKSLQENK